MNDIFKDETGENTRTTYEFVANALQWAIGDLGKTMQYFRAGAYDYEMDRELSKGLGLRNFRTWLKEDSKYVSLQK